MSKPRYLTCNGITEYTKRMNELQAQMKYLADQYEKGKISENEYRKEMEAVRAVSTQYKDNVRILRKELQNNVRQQQENEGSLKQLRAVQQKKVCITCRMSLRKFQR